MDGSRPGGALARAPVIAGGEHDSAAYRRRGALLVAAAALCWSAGGLLARLVDAGPWATVFWRGVFCASFLLVVLAVRHRARLPAAFLGMGVAGLGVACCLAAASTVFIMALTRTSVANVLIILSTGPFIAGLLGWAWMGERVAGRTWIAMGAALAGTVVMVSGSWAAGTATGDLLAFLVAGVFAVAAVILRRHRDVPMLPAACLGALIAAAVAWPQLAGPLPAPADLALLAVFGAAQLGLGLILFTAGAPRIPVAQTSLIAVLECVLGPVWVWLALGEHPGARSLAGGAVVLLALIAHTVADLRRSAAEAVPDEVAPAGTGPAIVTARPPDRSPTSTR